MSEHLETNIDTDWSTYRHSTDSGIALELFPRGGFGRFKYTVKSRDGRASQEDPAHQWVWGYECFLPDDPGHVRRDRFKSDRAMHLGKAEVDVAGNGRGG